MTPTRAPVLDPSVRGGIVVDRARFPIVVMRFRGTPDADAFAAFFTAASALFDRTRAFVLVIDGARAAPCRSRASATSARG